VEARPGAVKGKKSQYGALQGKESGRRGRKRTHVRSLGSRLAVAEAALLVEEAVVEEATQAEVVVEDEASAEDHSTVEADPVEAAAALSLTLTETEATSSSEEEDDEAEEEEDEEEEEEPDAVPQGIACQNCLAT
jgi:hypothetical protein